MGITVLRMNKIIHTGPWLKSADIDYIGGAYSAPAYGGVAPNETYAEWFWWYSNNHYAGADKSDCLEYRLETYGPDWDYDDGFANFTASAYDPKEWVDLFADAVSITPLVPCSFSALQYPPSTLNLAPRHADKLH